MASSSSSGAAIGCSVYDVTEEKTNGTRLARLLIDEGTCVLRRFLQSCIYPPKTLGDLLQMTRPKLQHLKSKRVIFDGQWEKLFPSSGVPLDAETFDITLLHLLIRELCNLMAPITGWQKMPADDDESLAACITRIKCFRNELCHSPSTGIPNSEFEDKWNKISSSLKIIKLEVYGKKIQSLKNDPIDHDTRQAVEEEVEQWRHLQQQEMDERIGELCSYLPDTLPKDRMFGRSQQINKVKEYLQNEAVSVVVISGGPGFGKTTVARAVAHELAKPENGKTVLFCSLLSKETFNEVATEMINSCGKTPTQLPENPEQWLKEWSKQIQTEVTFVLDNADGVLESEDRKTFLSTLSAIRKLSTQKVTFVITSRKKVQDSNILSLREVTLQPLSPEEGERVLVSRVSDEEIRKKLCKTEKIAELCGYVPLALCIVGSLLADYPEESLIKHLEEEPMSLLEDEDVSFQTAIKTSFDFLTKWEQDALVLLSVFPGSFDCNAAEAVIRARSDTGARSGALPISILRSLKNRSLIEQPHSRRYQLHPLVRAFSTEIAKTMSEPPPLDRGNKLACEHFMFRVNENSKRYWSKNTCRASIECFSKDRDNFEYFLQVFAEGMEKHDPGITDSCKIFLQDSLQTCMYLEMCLSPRFYVQFLERLLESFKEPDFQHVRVVEIMCLLGHEIRKVGQKAKYHEYMEQAKTLHSENSSEFTTNAISEVFVINSYADCLNKKGDPAHNKQVLELNETALKVCNEKLGVDHPETAATLLFAGRFAKSMRKPFVADQKLQEARTIFQERLGVHFMTVRALKESGDRFLADGTEQDLEKASMDYKEALEMMEQLEMEKHKENIHILKNYGSCAAKRGSHQEAKEYILKAYNVAETELEQDHMWKVLIKQQLAALHEDIAKVEEKEDNLDKTSALYKEALEMLQRLDAESNNESIRTMKDYGMFLMRRGKVWEATEHFEKAYLLADRELEPNHMWKVTIKIQLALLKEKVERIEEAKRSMQDGLKMLYNRKMKVSKLWNSTDVVEFLDRHRKDFPKDTFPR